MWAEEVSEHISDLKVDDGHHEPSDHKKTIEGTLEIESSWQYPAIIAFSDRTEFTDNIEPYKWEEEPINRQMDSTSDNSFSETISQNGFRNLPD